MEEKNTVKKAEAKKSNLSLFKSRRAAAVLEIPSVMFSSSSFLHAFQTVDMSSEYRACSPVSSLASLLFFFL